MNTFGKRVAVIGAGPSGLAAARYLKAHGFVPVVYDRGEGLGGQWSAVAASEAAMRANTSRVTTRFSELDYPAETSGFPQKGEVLAYLESYAEKFSLAECLRLNTDVETVARHPAGGWVVHSRRSGEPPRTEIFLRVVVATGRFSKPAQPNVAGLDSFAGSGGVLNCFDYDGPERFAGKTVLVAGSSIAALEIACDLAQAGVTVISTARRHRSVLRKDFAGLPSHNVAVTRFAGLAGECQPLEAVACGLEQFIARSSGFPAEFAGLPPVGDVFEPWIAVSEQYFRLLGEGRIAAKPQPESVEDGIVQFIDGSSAEVDAIVFDTSFEIDLPFLDLRTRKVLGLEGGRLDLADCTFHPDLDGLALVGLFPQASPYFPVVELQARWVAYVWAGLAPVPSREELQAEFEKEGFRPGGFRDAQARAMALRFA
jgi:dimethylaniline monooxygenase (N-oxide forming)